MGGQGFSRHPHPDPHFSPPGGEVFSELELLGRSDSPSSAPSSCRCCGCRRRHGCYPSYSSPTSELEVEGGSAGNRGENGDCGGDGGQGEPGEVGGARSSVVDNEMTGNRGSSIVPPREESLVSVDGLSPSAPGYTEEDISRRRQRRAYCELLSVYRDGGSGTGRLAFLAQAKEAIERYTPGKWIERVGGAEPTNYRVPSTTTLLLVGPRSSGKSALVNRISRLLEEDASLPDRAQVSHNVPTAEGTCFLQEYMIPRDSTSFCVYDTRGLSEVASENFHVLKKWMNEGVRHGEMVLRESDSTAVKSKIKAMARDMRCSLFVRRRVNFVIFVVSGLSVLKTINSSDRQYTDMLVKTFNYSFMSFRDNKPVAVVTHGDLLSFHERALVCTHLGELLGIPATTQIFDIPDLDCVMTNLAIVDLLRYSLEQADRNLPLTSAHELEGTKFHQLVVRRFQDFEVWILILEVVGVFICAFILLTHSLAQLVKS